MYLERDKTLPEDTQPLLLLALSNQARLTVDSRLEPNNWG